MQKPSAPVVYQEHATIHLLPRAAEEIRDVRFEELESEYPGLSEMVRHGDIIEFLGTSGYRSQGVAMVQRLSDQNPEIVPLNTKYDDYGSVSECFVVFRDFPPDYWTKGYNRGHQLFTNDTFAPGRTSQFYWHSDESPAIYDVEALRKALPTLTKLERFHNNDLEDMDDSENSLQYTIVRFRNKRYGVVLESVVVDRLKQGLELTVIGEIVDTPVSSQAKYNEKIKGEDAALWVRLV
jgi:hypothetical protein